jgi:1,4-alpha-glucan branching enzyme
MMTHPGKKLLFMGGEIGQLDEWKDLQQLDWDLLENEKHIQMQNYVRDLNQFYLNEPCWWELDHDEKGFDWIDPNNNQQSIIVFMRKRKANNDFTIIICNFTPQYYGEYKIGVPRNGVYREVFNSDLEKYGGSGKKNTEGIKVVEEGWHNQPYHINMKIPPLGFSVLKLSQNC